MLAQIVKHAGQQMETPARREGACGHRQRLVGMRPKQLHTLMGKMTITRAYYQCIGKDEENESTCSHGHIPFDEIWGLSGGQTSPGVQQLVGKRVSRMTLTEAVDSFTSILPLPLSERQALNIIQPVGEALREQEGKQAQQIFEQATCKDTSQESPVQKKTIRRLYIEADGVMARLRLGSVPMREAENESQRDVYREIKVGAVFEAVQGRERSELAPGVFLDEPGPIKYFAQRLSVELGRHWRS